MHFLYKKDYSHNGSPLSSLANGPDDEESIIWVCKECNSSKGSKRVYELWTNRKGFEGAKYEVPRIAEGKYLKLIFETMREEGILNLSMSDTRRLSCPIDSDSFQGDV